MSVMEMFFGKRRKGACPGRKKKGRKVRKLSRSAKVMINGKKRKVYKGCNGGLYYKRTKNGKTVRVYIDPKILRRRSSMRMGGGGHTMSAGKKRRRLKQSKAAKRRRALYRRRKNCKKRGGRWKRGKCTHRRR